MDIRQLFASANRALNTTIQAIPDEKWLQVMPDDFPTFATEPQTLRTVINYHAYDDAWLPVIAAGKTMTEVGIHTYDGDLLGDDPKGNYAGYNMRASEAVMALTNLTTILHFSYGDFAARDGLLHLVCYRGFRAYDLARVTGVSTSLPADMVTGLWEQLVPVVESYRAMNVFGPAVEVPADAPLQDRLLGLVGRDPTGRPSHT